MTAMADTSTERHDVGGDDRDGVVQQPVDQPQDRAAEIHAQHGQGQILRALAAHLDSCGQNDSVVVSAPPRPTIRLQVAIDMVHYARAEIRGSRIRIVLPSSRVGVMPSNETI